MACACEEHVTHTGGLARNRVETIILKTPAHTAGTEKRKNIIQPCRATRASDKRRMIVSAWLKGNIGKIAATVSGGKDASTTEVITFEHHNGCTCLCCGNGTGET
jgi:hypothetical protein